MKKLLRPYLFISACGILAFAPISFMLRALKNDIIALEYPINQFMSQCIRSGKIPAWFDTWSMGFPLQSNLSWGIYSTPQLVFSGAFDYNIYTLHIEFIFFILLAGWSMFYLLKKHFVKEENTAVLLSVCYMLSGFMVGSTQWLLYITAAAFTPIVVASLLSLLQRPNAKHAFQFAVCYTLMFTSVYAAFNIIATYGIAALVIAWFWKQRKDLQRNRQLAGQLLLSLLMTLLLCGPCLYFTMELLGNLDRGTGLETGSAFFNSNYLHPGALSSLLFPFSSVKMAYVNTEGTMLNTYTGLFVLLTLPAGVAAAIRSRNKLAWGLLAAALLMLLVSFGNLTPLRRSLNILPGFSYFRNPALFRFYFIFLLILFMAVVFRDKKTGDILGHRLTRYSLLLTGAICIVTLLLSTGSLKSLSLSSIPGLLQTAGHRETLFISAMAQLLFLLLLLVFIYKKKWSLAGLVFLAEMIINTLLCTPYFSVSSYTPSEVNSFLKIEKGFPVQAEAPSVVPTTYTDPSGNSWQNVNVFTKKVSAQEAYCGPLILKGMNDSLTANKSHSLVYIHGRDISKTVLVVSEQKPGLVRVFARHSKPSTITLLQNYYPGWKVFVNDKAAILAEKGRPGLSVAVPAGDNTVVFKYERKAVWLSALLVHLAVLAFGIMKLRDILPRIRSSSPS